MIELSKKTANIWLSLTEYPLEAITSSAYIRSSLITTVKDILEEGNDLVSTEKENTQKKLHHLEVFLNSIQSSNQLYQASLSRQLAAGLAPDIEQTTLKDEPKDWFIKTADFCDDCNKIFPHSHPMQKPNLPNLCRQVTS